MKRYWKLIVGIFFMIGGAGNMGSSASAAALGIVAGTALLAWQFIPKRSKDNAQIGVASVIEEAPNGGSVPGPAEKVLRSSRTIVTYQDEYITVYKYPGVELTMIDPALDLGSLPVGESVGIIMEPENEFDNKAVYIEIAGGKIGYIRRGRHQSMIHDFTGQEKAVAGLLKMVDLENRIVKIELAFLQSIESIKQSKEAVSAKLLKTNKRDCLDTPRSEHLELASVGDYVDLDYDSDSERYIVSSETGDELGELNASVSERIQDSGVAKKLAVIESLEENEAGKIAATILIYL
jgi:hypothetical protein